MPNTNSGLTGFTLYGRRISFRLTKTVVVHFSPDYDNEGAFGTSRDASHAMPAAARKSVRTSVILPEDSHVRIQALAEANNVSTAWVIRTAVLRFLDEHGDQTQLPLRLPKSKKSSGP